MSKFLGVDYDKWHFILAFLGSIGAFLAFYWLIPWDENPAVQVLLPMILAAGLIFAFQYWNESYQRWNWEKNYPSLIAFETDSRQDWRYFWYGIFAGQFVNGLLGGLIL